jgi:TonB family protein
MGDPLETYNTEVDKFLSKPRAFQPRRTRMKLATAIVLSVGVFATLRAAEIQSVSAIDARGVRYVQQKSDYRAAPAAWKADTVFAAKPDYPNGERNLRHEGVVIVRLEIDVKTGTTKYVTLLQSSGFPILDEVAIRRLSRWRWRPGTWKQVEVPVVFTISGRRIDGW